MRTPPDFEILLEAKRKQSIYEGFPFLKFPYCVGSMRTDNLALQKKLPEASKRQLLLRMVKHMYFAEKKSYVRYRGCSEATAGAGKEKWTRMPEGLRKRHLSDARGAKAK